MVYNDAVNGQGLVQDTYFRVGLDATQGAISYPINDLTRNANIALDDVAALIIGADGRWQFDDTNYTTLPIGTTDLILNQQDYTFDPEYLDVIKVEVKDTQGNWYEIEPFDIKDLKKGQSLTDYYKTAGAPAKYDKMANSIILYPKPDYAQLQSLKVYFQRKMDYFVATDTTKQPGFNRNLHAYVSICMAHAYAAVKGLSQLQGLANEKLIYADKIVKAYSARSKDEKPKITNKPTLKI